jgi:pyruvate dehydrogenase (quinone)
MAAQTVADYLLARLREWGVQHVFGYPGDGINGLLAAWGRAEDQPRFVQARHEEMAAFEAAGYAKFTGRVGFCAATSGPGAIHTAQPALRRQAAMQASLDADPINPMRLFAELSSRLPGDAIVTADSGSAANWYARQLRFRGSMRGSLSGTLATMGSGVPYGIGAKFGCPHRPVIAFAGDGAMQMNGLAELITIKRYWAEWADPRLVVAVLHNDDLNQVTWELRAMGGAPKFVESQRLPDVDYAGFAAGLGLQAIAVDKPEDVGPAWDRALGADRPTVLDVRCDPDVPPVPLHATFAQMKDAAQALLHGDEDRRGVIKQGVKTKLQEFLPRRQG